MLAPRVVAVPLSPSMDGPPARSVPDRSRPVTCPSGQRLVLAAVSYTNIGIPVPADHEPTWLQEGPHRPAAPRPTEALSRALVVRCNVDPDQRRSRRAPGCRPVPPNGRNGRWCRSRRRAGNRTFRIGSDLAARLASAQGSETTVIKEQRWVPYLAAHLSLEVPEPVALGRPALGYPFAWSITRWLDGEVLSRAQQLEERVLSFEPGRPPTEPFRPTNAGGVGGPIGRYDDEEVRTMLELIVRRVHRKEDLVAVG